MRADALSAARRDELDRAARPAVVPSAEEGLRQLWDLLDLLEALSGPLPANRAPVKGLLLL